MIGGTPLSRQARHPRRDITATHPHGKIIKGAYLHYNPEVDLMLGITVLRALFTELAGSPSLGRSVSSVPVLMVRCEMRGEKSVELEIVSQQWLSSL